MIAEKWKPVFGNDHPQKNMGAVMMPILRQVR
jgi:hypothetical protein